MPYGGYYEYVSAAEKRARSRKAAEKLKKENPGIHPIVVNGSRLASTWWGKAWNKNLESYADYENRIGRGRSYVRQGAVLHLDIKPGKVEALVQGSARKPYEIHIDIGPLNVAKWEHILSTCEGKLDSLQELLQGKFPKALEELFTSQKQGLFPSPKEIQLRCSCPDYAVMCKHVAAALYGVGTRLDEDPSLFFVLREVSMDALIEKAIQKKAEKLLEKSGTRSRRIMEDKDVSGLFGIDMMTQKDRKSAEPLPAPAAKPLPIPAVKPEEAVKRGRGRPRKLIR